MHSFEALLPDDQQVCDPVFVNAIIQLLTKKKTVALLSIWLMHDTASETLEELSNMIRLLAGEYPKMQSHSQDYWRKAPPLSPLTLKAATPPRLSLGLRRFLTHCNRRATRPQSRSVTVLLYNTTTRITGVGPESLSSQPLPFLFG